MAIPPSALIPKYSRQQLCEATGLPPETVAYWVKERLLLATEGEGEGRGKHRRFGFEAVQIAAILGELSRYGLNAAGLATIASTLWEAVHLGWRHSDITEIDLINAKLLTEKRRQLASREDLEAAGASSQEDTFEEWLAETFQGKAKLTEKAFEVEKWFNIADANLLYLHFDLCSSRINDGVPCQWFILTVPSGGSVIIPEATSKAKDLDAAGSYIVINLPILMSKIGERLG